MFGSHNFSVVFDAFHKNGKLLSNVRYFIFYIKYFAKHEIYVMCGIMFCVVCFKCSILPDILLKTSLCILQIKYSKCFHNFMKVVTCLRRISSTTFLGLSSGQLQRYSTTYSFTNFVKMSSKDQTLSSPTADSIENFEEFF